MSMFKGSSGAFHATTISLSGFLGYIAREENSTTKETNVELVAFVGSPPKQKASSHEQHGGDGGDGFSKCAAAPKTTKLSFDLWPPNI